jgi:hypothetical protein
MSNSATQFPDARYLQQRAEIAKKTKTKSEVVATINRCLDDGGTRSFTKAVFQGAGEPDWKLINEFIAEWELRGLLRIVKPIDEASASDVVVEMLNYIDQEKSPWPNWPVKSA